MKFIARDSVTQAFSLLNRTNCEFLILRNTNNELPNRLEEGKDIDILVNPKDRLLFKQKAKAFFKKIKHPLSSSTRLYGVHEFEFYKPADRFFIDVSYEAVCMSLDKGQWIPLDNKIQKDIWRTKIQIKVGKELVYIPSIELQLVLMLVRCVFDKKEFSSWHRGEIERLFDLSDTDLVLSYLKLIFFSFSNSLLIKLKDRSFEDLIESYIQYSNY